MSTNLSGQLYEDAKTRLIGGVNSPVRALKSVGLSPVFMRYGKGPYLYSVDGKRYVDYMLSFGPLLLGHAHPEVCEAVRKAVDSGFTFGAPTESESILASLVQRYYPSMEKMRFVSSGTEATMSALRVARGFTKRSLIVKFSGCYHGHSDGLLVEAGSGGLTFGKPTSAGVPDAYASCTRVVAFNDVDQLNRLFQEEGDSIAAVIMEPVCGNMGLILPDSGYLESVRSLCDDYGSLLIFDEVMTGFRVHPGGAQALFNVKPDLTCLGKVIGGGFPCGAFGGRADVMALLSPEGDVYQAGTLSGNPVAMAAGIKTLELLKQPSLFEKASRNTIELTDGLDALISSMSLPCHVVRCGTMFSLFFRKEKVRSLLDVQSCDIDSYNALYRDLMEQGVYLAPSQFEANFMSVAHQGEDIVFTLQAFELAFKRLL